MRRTATRPTHRSSQSASSDFISSSLRESTTRGRSSLDIERPADQSSTFFTARRPRDDVNNMSTKFEVDEEGGDDPGAALIAQLRRDLREAEKEIDRLNSLGSSLQSQLASRPPLAKVQNLEREHSQLELLYHSTQRENQSCMARIEEGKRREKILESEVAKVFGDNWMEHLNLTGQLNPSTVPGLQSSPTLASRAPLSASVARRPSVVTRGMSSHRVHTVDQSSPAASPQASPSLRHRVPLGNGPLTGDGSADGALREHMEQIRSLILGMDQKMKLQDEKLEGMQKAAKEAALSVSGV